MARTAITPTGVEKTFQPDQIIVSKTDLQGRLTYVNDLFVEISGYQESELIGQPHNVIRHPSMPRSVFRLLWERISAGQEIFPSTPGPTPGRISTPNPAPCCRASGIMQNSTVKSIAGSAANRRNTGAWYWIGCVLSIASMVRGRRPA